MRRTEPLAQFNIFIWYVNVLNSGQGLPAVSNDLSLQVLLVHSFVVRSSSYNRRSDSFFFISPRPSAALRPSFIGMRKCAAACPLCRALSYTPPLFDSIMQSSFKPQRLRTPAYDIIPPSFICSRSFTLSPLHLASRSLIFDL